MKKGDNAMTNKRKSKSSVVRAKARRQRQPVPPPVVPKPPSPDTTPAAPPASAAPKPPTPAPSPVVAPKAPAPTTPPQPPKKSWQPGAILLGIVAVIVILLLGSLILTGRNRQVVASPTTEPSAMPVASATQAPQSSATPAATKVTVAQAKVPDGFCENKDGLVTNATARWPSTDPCPGKLGKWVVVKGQSAPGVYELDNKSFSTYAEVTKAMLTGTLWFEPEKSQAPTSMPSIKATATSAPTATATSSYEVVPGVTLGQCTTKATREERLDCATALYFANGEKLSGIKAYFYALGITWTDLKVGDPFQPDANPLPSGSPRIWGALVKGTNVTVTGNACLVTDVPIRIASFKWTFLDTRYAPRPTVGHYGEAVSVVNQLVELAIHGDCSDWSEIRDVAQAAGFSLK